MSELRELYQEVILDHTRNPRNKRSIEQADESAEGFNPLCGDRATIFVKLEGDRISDVSFEGRGCSISTASASMMTEALRGKTRAEAEAMFESFHELITRAPDAVAPVEESLGQARRVRRGLGVPGPGQMRVAPLVHAQVGARE